MTLTMDLLTALLLAPGFVGCLVAALVAALVLNMRIKERGPLRAIPEFRNGDGKHWLFGYWRDLADPQVCWTL
jgi:hypothetical protein